MSRSTPIWARRIALVLLALLAAYLLYPFLTSALRAGVGLVMAVVTILAYLLAAIALPVGLFTLFKFAYSVFLRPFIRLRRIKRIRHARYMREAVQRGRFKVIVNPRHANSDQPPSPPTTGP